MENIDKISNSTNREDLWNIIYDVVNKLILINSDGKDMMDKPSCTTQIVKIVEEYGKQQYNKAVFDCAEKAYKQMYDIGEYEEVVKESILELIKE